MPLPFDMDLMPPSRRAGWQALPAYPFARDGSVPVTRA